MYNSSPNNLPEQPYPLLGRENASSDAQKQLGLDAVRMLSLRDIYDVFSGFAFCTAEMLEEIKIYNARQLGSRFEVPFFLFHGETDVITLTPLAQEYFEEIEAPIKQIAFIKNAGHFAAFTHPEPFLKELVTHVHPIALD